MATRHRVSPHFVIEEFDCHDGTHVAAANHDDIERLAAWVLEPLRDEFGPVHVMSGYRTVSHNRMIGGALHSVHLLATPLPQRERRARDVAARSAGDRAAAADVIPQKGSPQKWAAWLQKHRRAHAHLGHQGRGGIGLYVASGFVHVDTASQRDWTG